MSLPVEVQGPGYSSRSGASKCFGMFGYVWGLRRHNFFKNLYIFSFSRILQFCFNTSLETWWCFDLWMETPPKKLKSRIDFIKGKQIQKMTTKIEKWKTKKTNGTQSLDGSFREHVRNPKIVWIYLFWCVFLILSSNIWKLGTCTLHKFWFFDLPCTISTRNSYHSDERAFHNLLVPSHHPWRHAARFAVSPICFLDTSEVETMTLQQIMLVSSL